MKREAPAAARNREPIAAVLKDELPQGGTVLELASGTGEHVVHFAAAFPQLQWQPSDPDSDARASIAAWSSDSGLTNIAPPLALDASEADAADLQADAILCINMVHISPVEATHGLMELAGRLLPDGAPLILYGPYIEDDVETVQSNLDFDASLKARNPAWGLRNTAWMDEIAAGEGLVRSRRVQMPANNLMLVYRRRSAV